MTIFERIKSLWQNKPSASNGLVELPIAKTNIGVYGPEGSGNKLLQSILSPYFNVYGFSLPGPALTTAMPVVVIFRQFRENISSQLTRGNAKDHKDAIAKITIALDQIKARLDRDDRVLFVQYEDIVFNPEFVEKQIYEFTGTRIQIDKERIFNMNTKHVTIGDEEVRVQEMAQIPMRVVSSEANVAVVSIMRDMGSRVDKYFDQLNAVRWPNAQLRAYVVEGDSKDDTWQKLKQHAVSPDLDKVVAKKLDLGTPVFGHTVNEERFEALATSYNAALDLVLKDDWADFVMIVESDLLYGLNHIVDLAYTMRTDKDITCGMVWAGSETFYDIWGYRDLDGKNLGSFKKSHYFANYPNLVELGSAGSCLFFSTQVIKKSKVRLTKSDALVGFCNVARSRGYKILCNTRIELRHP